MQCHPAYAVSPSQPEPSAATAVDDGGDVDQGTLGTGDLDTNEESGNVSDQDTGGQQEGQSDQDMGGQISDGFQGDDGQTDQEENVEDDDEWADGDDEWTDEWTGADDEMEGNEWADDRDKNQNKNEDKEESELKSETDSVDGIESYDGKEEYIVRNRGVSVSSTKSSRAALDTNYQTGAGLGNDISLILAVICGITAIGLAARKRKHEN